MRWMDQQDLLQKLDPLRISLCLKMGKYMDQDDLIDKDPLTVLGGQFIRPLPQIVEDLLCQSLQLLFVGKTGQSYDRIKNR